MKFLEQIPTQDDLIRAVNKFEATFSTEPIKKHQCFEYWQYFAKSARASEDTGNEGIACANDLFYAVSFGSIDPDSNEIRSIAENMHAGRSPSEGLLPDDGSNPNGFIVPIVFLRKEHYEALKQILPNIADAELRARIADTLWLIRRDHHSASVAVDAYISAGQQLNADSWVHGEQRLRRALQLEKSRGVRNGPALTAVNAELHNRTGDPSYCSSFLMQELLDLRMGDGAVYAPLAEAAAKEAEDEDEPDWDRAQRYWELAAQWWAKTQDGAKRQDALTNLAECCVRHGDSILDRPNQILPNSHASYWIEQAIHTLRNVQTESAKIRRQELHRRLRQIQERIPGEMPLIAHSVDFSTGAAEATRLVSELPLLNALKVMANLENPPGPKVICRNSYENSKAKPFLSWLPKVMIGATGGTVAREVPDPKISNDRLARKRERRRVRMIQYASLNQICAAQGIILPCLGAINAQHRLSVSALTPMLELCEFVPPGMELLVAKGLVAGARNDWAISSYLLVSAVEAGLRRMLLILGSQPPLAVQSGEREWGMQEFLLDEDCLNRLRPIFGEGLLYSARVLLVEKFGANLRPNVAHGLLSNGAFYPPFVYYLVYLWWLTLRLCFATLSYQASLQQIAENENSA